MIIFEESEFKAMPTDVYLVRCGSCGTRNRIPSENARLQAKCGKCGSTIETADLFSGEPLVVTDQTFQTKILNAPVPVLLDCWAPWCGPCRMISPVLETLAGLWKGKILIAKLNVDENPVTATKFNIQSIPTLLIFDNGQMKDRLTGAVPRQEIERKMAPFLG